MDDLCPEVKRLRADCGERIINLRELVALLSLSARQIDRLEAAGDFPKRVRLGSGRVGWLSSEVGQWIDNLAARRGKPTRAL